MSDYVKSDSCFECGGQGFIWTTEHVDEGEQCPMCEHLHEIEVRADNYTDMER